jgi:hypothetical protein
MKLVRPFALVAMLLLALGATSAMAQATPTLRITGPADGATVANPVTVAVQTSGATIKATTENDPNASHLHYFIDRDPASVLKPGEPIPSGQPDIIHTPDLSLQLPSISNGRHTVWVVLAHNDHTPFTPNVQAQVSFVVGAPGQAAAPEQAGSLPQSPRTGTGGLLTSAGYQSEFSPASLALLALAATLVIAGLTLARRSSR